MRDFRLIADECVAYFTALEKKEGLSQEAFRQGAVAARAWQALLALPWTDTQAARALFVQMQTHRRYRYWSVHWHYMAEMMNAWHEAEGIAVEPILKATDGGLKEAYEQFGFVVVRQLLAPETALALKVELQRIVAEKGHHAGVFVGLAARSLLFREAIRDPRLLDALEPLLGPEIEFLSDKVVYKSAETDYGSPWHQDWPYWKGAHKLSIWVALDTATPDNGCLKLLPGSHRSVVAHTGEAPEGEGFGHRLEEGKVEEDRAVSVPCGVGDAVFFHDLVLHASHPNRSGQDRYAWIVTYRNADEEDLTYDWAVAAERVRGQNGTMPSNVNE